MDVGKTFTLTLSQDEFAFFFKALSQYQYTPEEELLWATIHNQLISAWQGEDLEDLPY